jgi:hypothetical protein
MNQQVFYDPQRKRWKRLRRIFDLLALSGLLLGSVFVVRPDTDEAARAVSQGAEAKLSRAGEWSDRCVQATPLGHRRTDVKPGDVPA